MKLEKGFGWVEKGVVGLKTGIVGENGYCWVEKGSFGLKTGIVGLKQGSFRLKRVLLC